MMSAVSTKLPADTRRITLLSIARAQVRASGASRKMAIRAEVSTIIAGIFFSGCGTLDAGLTEGRRRHKLVFRVSVK